MRIRNRLATLGALLALAVPATASAAPLPAGTASDVYATGGDVWASFVGKNAEYTSFSYFFGSMYPGDLTNPLAGAAPGTSTADATFLFNNNVTTPGSTVHLGAFASSTRLVFGIYVQNLDKWFYTGPGGWNPDAKIHAQITEPSPEAGYQARLGFEDLCKPYEPCQDLGYYSDWDYNDHIFDLTNVTATPEPVSMALLGTGLAGLAATRRRRRKDNEVESAE